MLQSRKFVRAGRTARRSLEPSEAYRTEGLLKGWGVEAMSCERRALGQGYTLLGAKSSSCETLPKVDFGAARGPPRRGKEGYSQCHVL